MQLRQPVFIVLNVVLHKMQLLTPLDIEEWMLLQHSVLPVPFKTLLKHPPFIKFPEPERIELKQH